VIQLLDDIMDGMNGRKENYRVALRQINGVLLKPAYPEDLFLAPIRDFSQAQDG
jgi:hypothetical protein